MNPTTRNASLALFLLALAALSPGCAWFLMGGVAAGLYAIQGGKDGDAVDNPPSVVLPTPARFKESPALVTYTLLDPEGAPCSIEAEFSLDDGATWSPATQGAGGDPATGLAATPGGSSHDFSWDFAADATAAEQSVKLRIRAFDGANRGPYSETGAFTAGNVQPVISQINPPMGTVTGTATVTYVVSDTQSDAAEIEIQFKRESDPNDWSAYGCACTSEVTGAASNLSTSAAGLSHFFPWDTTSAWDLPGEDADVKIRIRARDGTGDWGGWTVSESVASIRNNSKPFVLIDAVDASQSGLVYIPFTCYDNESHEVSIIAEYLALGASSWRRATAGPGTSPMRFQCSSGGVSGAFVWDSRRDGVSNTSVTVRICPSEADLEGLPGSANFAIGNSEGVWSVKEKFPELWMDQGFAVAAGKLFVIGGVSTVTACKAVWSYDPGSNDWNREEDMPTARGSLCCGVAGGKIYAIGGVNKYIGASAGGLAPSNAVEVYDPSTHAWGTAPLAAMSTARYGAACAVYRDKIYVTGGAVGSNATIDPQALTAVEIYEPATDSWTSGNPMPSARFDHACAELDGRIYAVGGRMTDFNDQTGTVYEYDPEGGGWSAAAAMPTARGNLSCLAYGGKVYAFGGGDGFYGSCVVEVYDTATSQWSAEGDMPLKRSGHGSLLLDGRFYVVGGNDVNFIQTQVDAYDPPAKGKWTARASLSPARGNLCAAPSITHLHAIGGEGGLDLNTGYEPPPANAWSAQPAMPTQRRGACCAALSGKIFVFGGTPDYVTFLNTVEVYDGLTSNWTTGLAPMPTARANASCAVAAGKIYVIAGGNGSPFAETGAVEAYDPVSDSWTTGLAPMPEPRTHGECAAVGGKIYILGGHRPSVLQLPDYGAVYDPYADSWETGPAVPNRVYHGGSALLGAMVFVFGGRTTTGLSSQVAAYDVNRKMWRSYAALPTQRLCPAGAAMKGAILAVGGGAGTSLTGVVESFTRPEDPLFRDLGSLMEGVSGACLAAVDNEVYLVGGRAMSMTARNTALKRPFIENIPAQGGDTGFAVQETWTDLPNMTAARCHAGVLVYGGGVYVFGGVDDSGTPLASVDYYDPMFATWSSPTSMPTARSGLKVVMKGDRIWAIGGDTGGGTKTSVVEAYDPAWGTWDAVNPPAMPSARSHFGCCLEPNTGRVYVFGGEATGGTPLNSVHYYDLAGGGGWQTPSTTMPVALEGCLCLIEGGRLKLFGGQRSDASMSDQVWIYDHIPGTWTRGGTLPYAARDLFGCSTVRSWHHRDETSNGEHHDEFVLLGGGFDGANERQGFFRFYTR